MTSAARSALLVFALACGAAAPHAVLEARVVKIVDGDTLDARSGSREVRVRLHAIDTPERDQPYAREASEQLASLVAGRDVRLETYGDDKHGRLLARVFVGDLDVNAELVRRGAAMVFRRYSDDAALLALEREARTEKRGLWALPESERVPPWEWRHRSTAATAFQCGAKTFCREMASCAEARFYLEKCGLARLDGDGDGVPCSSLCKR